MASSRASSMASSMPDTFPKMDIPMDCSGHPRRLVRACPGQCVRLAAIGIALTGGLLDIRCFEAAPRRQFTRRTAGT